MIKKVKYTVDSISQLLHYQKAFCVRSSTCLGVTTFLLCAPDGTNRLIQTSLLSTYERILVERVDLSTEAHHGPCHTQVSARCKRRIVDRYALENNHHHARKPDCTLLSLWRDSAAGPEGFHLSPSADCHVFSDCQGSDRQGHVGLGSL